MLTKRIVVPGEVLTEEKKRIGTHVFIADGKIRAECLGVYDADQQSVSVIPLNGKYIPKREDIVLGIVYSEQYAGYLIDVNSFYYSFVMREDVQRPLSKRDVFFAKKIFF